MKHKIEIAPLADYYVVVAKDKETEELYKRLQEMYELMSHTGFSEDVEQAIFSYEDCVTEEDYKAWYEKYSYYNS